MIKLVYDHNERVANVNKREKGRVDNYRLTSGCNAAKNTKQNKTNPIKPNNASHINRKYIYDPLPSLPLTTGTPCPIYEQTHQLPPLNATLRRITSPLPSLPLNNSLPRTADC